MSKCFISHSSVDQSFVAAEIASLIESVGISPWYASESVKTPEQWEISVLNGLKDSDWFVLVVSESSATSQWVKAETEWAMKNLPHRFIAIIKDAVDPLSLHSHLPQVQQVDFANDRLNARAKLIKLLIDVEYRPMRKANAIHGNWAGSISQDMGPKYKLGLEFPVKGKLQAFKNTIEGYFEVDPPFSIEGPAMLTRFNIVSGFFYDRFAQLNYMSNDLGTTQFGSIVVEVTDDGRSFSGNFVGYGVHSNSIVTGKLVMSKQ